MKSIILLSCLICVQLNAQNCMVGQSPVDILEYDYTASQFRLKGPVKRVTRIHETLNEKGDFETIHGVWGDHYFIDHLNFNEKGNLTSMYQETTKGDTMVIVKIEYDNEHRISKLTEHESSIWKKYEPFNGENWSSRYLYYSYDQNKLSSIKAIGDWHFSNTDSCRLDFEYKDGRVFKKTISDTENKTTHVRDYNYNAQTGLIEKEVISISSYGHDLGSNQFKYASDNKTLVSRVFYSPDMEYMSKESTWKYDAQRNIINYSSGDTLKENWFCYKDFQYNDLNDIVLEYSNSENDGRNRLLSTYTYVYDAFDNWTTKNIRVQNYIDFDSDTERKDVSRRLQEIEYYKL